MHFESRDFGINYVVKGKISTVKLTLRALALLRYFPIRLRRLRLERQPFLITFGLDYEDDVTSVSPSSAIFSLTSIDSSLIPYQIV